MMPNNKLALVENGWFPKTLQIYDSNSPYQSMVFSFLPCDNYGKSNNYGEDQPLEMNVTYDVRFLTYNALTSSGARKYNKTELEKIPLGTKGALLYRYSITVCAFSEGNGAVF